MPRQVRAVVVDPAAPGKLAIKPIELRDPDRRRGGGTSDRDLAQPR